MKGSMHLLKKENLFGRIVEQRDTLANRLTQFPLSVVRGAGGEVIKTET